MFFGGDLVLSPVCPAFFGWLAGRPGGARNKSTGGHRSASEMASRAGYSIFMRLYYAVRFRTAHCPPKKRGLTEL